ncbi:hypothetical protein STW0522RAO56_27570 [Raoultella planticola]|nr:hypothetical protein STW0522RAO56_27570 [Raoultella planticola]
MALRLSGLQYRAGRSRPGEPRETPQAGSGNAAIRLSPQDCPMALRLSGLQISCRPFTTGRAPGNPTGRIRQRRHPAIRAGLPDGAALIGPTNVVQAVHDRESPGEPHRPDQATPPSGYLRRTARWRDAYRAYNIVQAVNDRGSPGKPHRPDKATPPSGYLHGPARWRCAYRAYKYRAVHSRPGSPGKPTGRIRQRRHPAISAGLPDGATLIGPTNIVQAVHNRGVRSRPGEPRETPQAGSGNAAGIRGLSAPSPAVPACRKWDTAYRAAGRRS